MPTELDRLVLSSMPTFIALQYRKMLESDIIAQKARHALHVYELILRTLSLIMVSQYLVRDAQTVSHPRLDDLLLEALPTPTPDTWQRMLVFSLRCYEHLKGLLFVPELHDLAWDSSTTPAQPRPDAETTFASLARIWLGFIEGAHCSHEPTDSQTLSLQAVAQVRTLVQQCAFMADYDVIRILSRHASGYLYELLRGAHITPSPMPLQSQENLRIGGLYLSRQQHELLGLHPFLIYLNQSRFESDVELPAPDIAVYEHFAPDYVCYRTAREWKQVRDESAVPEFVRVVHYSIQYIKERRRKPEGFGWWQVREIARRVSLQRMARVLGKYNEALYRRRQDTLSVFEDFLASDKVCFVLAGKSGVGKSSFLLWLSHEYQRAHPEISLIMYDGARLEVRESLTEVVTRDFAFQRKGVVGQRQAADGIWQAIARIERIGERRVILAIDAINENADGSTLLRHIDELVGDSRWPWLKIVVTCRPETWRAIRAGVQLAEARYYRQRAEQRLGVEIESFRHSAELSPYMSDELSDAYDNYRSFYGLATAYADLSVEVREVLRDPLALQLVAQTYQGGGIPSNIKAEHIYQQYIGYLIETERLSARDLDFLTSQLVPLMIQEGQYANVIPAEAIERLVVGDGRAGPRPSLSGTQPRVMPFLGESYTNLLDAEILIRFGEGQDSAIAFKYERFYDYFGGKRLYELSNRKQNALQAYVDHITHMGERSFLWGPLRSALLLECQAGDHNRIIQLCQTLDHVQRDLLVAVLTDYGDLDRAAALALLRQLLEYGKTGWKAKMSHVASLLLQRRSRLPRPLQMGHRIAVEVSDALQASDILEQAAASPYAATRAAAVQHVYYLWKRNRALGWQVIDDLSTCISRAFRLPGLALLESCVGVSAVIAFENYQDANVMKQLAQRWHRIWKTFFSVQTDGTRAVATRFRQWRRHIVGDLAIWVVITLVLRTMRNLPPQYPLSVEELEHFMRLDATVKQQYRSLLPYLEGERKGLGNQLATLEALLRHWGLCGYAVGFVLMVEALQPPHDLDVLIRLVERATATEVPSAEVEALAWTVYEIAIRHPTAGSKLASLLAETITRVYEKYDDWLRRRKLAAPVGKRRYSDAHLLSYLVLLSQRFPEEVEGCLVEKLLDKAMSEHNAKFLGDFVSVELVDVGVNWGQPRLALNALRPLLSYRDEKLQEAIAHLFARMRTYYPRLVADFVAEGQVLPETESLATRLTTRESIGDIIALRGLDFIIDSLILGPKRVRHALRLSFDLAVEARTVSQWMKSVMKLLLDFISRYEVFPQCNSSSPLTGSDEGFRL